MIRAAFTGFGTKCILDTVVHNFAGIFYVRPPFLRFSVQEQVFSCHYAAIGAMIGHGCYIAWWC
jgi:hypothetical protein